MSAAVRTISHRRVFYELYADDEAFQAHEAGAHTRQFLSQRGQHLAAEPEVRRLSPTVGVVDTRWFGAAD